MHVYSVANGVCLCVLAVKRRRNWHRHDYSEINDGEKVHCTKCTCTLYMYMHVHACIYIVDTFIHLRLHAWTQIYIHVHLYMYMYVFICIVCMHCMCTLYMHSMQAVQTGTVVFVDNLKKNKKLW